MGNGGVFRGDSRSKVQGGNAWSEQERSWETKDKVRSRKERVCHPRLTRFLFTRQLTLDSSSPYVYPKSLAHLHPRSDLMTLARQQTYFPSVHLTQQGSKEEKTGGGWWPHKVKRAWLCTVPNVRTSKRDRSCAPRPGEAMVISLILFTVFAFLRHCLPR